MRIVESLSSLQPNAKIVYYPLHYMYTGQAVMTSEKIFLI
ncbi:hypothetical protein Mpsy_1795 [Methanolobus psychrophilus R15]|nr:hypothetical protein Mpsy_1795 [Methanolobus psychrophilus R15]